MTGSSPIAMIVRAHRRRRPRSARFPVTRVVPELGDVPDPPHPRRVYLVGSQSKPKWVAFDCPCGHGHRIEINVGSRSPWSATVAPTGITLTPSVDRRDGRRCHFWMYESRIRWC